MRPEAISNRIRLAYEVRAAVRRLVAEDGAVDALLGLAGSFVDTGINELSPDPPRVSVTGAKDDFASGAAEELSLPPIAVLMGGIVALIQGEDIAVPILAEPPSRSWLSIHRAPIQFRDMKLGESG